MSLKIEQQEGIEADAAPALQAERLVINIRHWPGIAGWKPPRLSVPTERLRRKLALLVVSLPQLGVLPERYGLGASLLVLGGIVLDAWLIYDDELSRDRVRALGAWARRRSHWIDTASGPRPLKVVSLSEYNKRALARHGYVGRRTIVGADLGRTLGLHADWCAPARRKWWTDAWSLGLRGWGVPGRKHPDRWVRSTGRPLVYVQGVSAFSLRAAFAKARPSFDTNGADDEPRGAWDRLASGKLVPYSGRFVEIIAASHSLSGTDSGDLDEQRAPWKLEPIGSPVAVAPDAHGALAVTRLVDATWRLALHLEDEAARWAGGLDLRDLHSPGATASALLVRMGVVAPLAKFHLSNDELVAWTAGLHGGWVAAERCGVSFPGVDIDGRSAYPAVAALLGWWDYLAARYVRRRDVTEAFREFLAAPDLAARMRERTTWQHWGLTRVALRLDGEPVPLEIPNEDRSGSRMVVTRARADRYDCAWPDAVLARLEADRAPVVLEAKRLDRAGRQNGLQRITIPGGELDPGFDPAVSLVRLRRQAKAEGDERLAQAIHAIVNSLVYGNFARFDPTDDGAGRPGPWCFPPIAATVAAGCRCFLALADDAVRRGGDLAPYRDTDGIVLGDFRTAL